jgi:hypothetical protein
MTEQILLILIYGGEEFIGARCSTAETARVLGQDWMGEQSKMNQRRLHPVSLGWRVDYTDTNDSRIVGKTIMRRPLDEPTF